MLLMALVGLVLLNLALGLVLELPVEARCSVSVPMVVLCLEVSHPGLEVGLYALDGLVVVRFFLLRCFAAKVVVVVQPSEDFLASLEEALLELTVDDFEPIKNYRASGCQNDLEVLRLLFSFPIFVSLSALLLA